MRGPVAAQEDWLNLGADQVRWDPDGRSLTAKGSVTAEHGEFRMQADEMSANLRDRTAQFRGKVRLTYRGETFEGESLSVSLATDEWEFAEARGTISPSFFQYGVVQPVIVGAKSIGGGPSLVSGGPATATTCDLARPHYRLEAKQLRIRPGRDLTARGVSFWVGNRRLLSVPSFWVSLREMRRQVLVPQVGESDLEGRYLKTRTGYVASDRSYGAILLDAMSRRGFGQGIEHFYGLGQGQGNVTLYHVRNPNTDLEEFSGRLTHAQPLGAGASLGLTANYLRNLAWYSGGSTLASLRANLDMRRGEGVSSADFSYNLSEGLSRLAQQSMALRHDRPGLSLSTAWQRNSTAPGQSDDQELNARLHLVREYAQADLSLDLSRRFDLDRNRYTGDNFYQVLDSLPALELSTTSARLGVPFLHDLPSRLAVSVGNFHEQPTNLTAYRANLLFEASPAERSLGKRTNLLWAGGLRQAFYGDKDHTAQYVYRADATVRHKMGDAALRLSYHLQEPKGFTPFRFDFISPYRFVSAALEWQARKPFSPLTGEPASYNPSSPLMGEDKGDSARHSPGVVGAEAGGGDTPPTQGGMRGTGGTMSVEGSVRRPLESQRREAKVSLLGGFDIENSRWQSLLLRANTPLSERVSLSTGAAYNLNEGEFGDVVTQARWKHGDDWLNLGARYDARRSRLRRIALDADMDLSPRWRLRYLTGYDRALRRFIYNEVLLIRDLHCWEALLYYSEQRKIVRLDFRIKAFEWGRRDFGTGRFGQRIDSTMPEPF